MIGFADLGVIAFLKQVVFADKDYIKGIVWAKPEIARQALAAKQGQGSIGTPGLSVYRTACEDDPSQPSLARASMGLPQGLLVGSPNSKRNRLKWIAQRVTYTIMCWAENQSDINSMERLLRHSTTYRAIDYTIKGMNDATALTRFPIFSGPRAYDAVLDKNAPQILEQAMQMQMIVEAPLILNVQVPVIETIQVAFDAYKIATNGEPVPDYVFDLLQINSQGAVSRLGP